MATSINATTTILELITAPYDPTVPKPIWNEPAFVIGTVATTLIMTWLAAGLRLYARLFIVKSLGWDDSLVVLFLLSGLTCSVTVMLCTSHRHHHRVN
jgi:hypothetical protein